MKNIHKAMEINIDQLRAMENKGEKLGEMESKGEQGKKLYKGQR